MKLWSLTIVITLCYGLSVAFPLDSSGRKTVCPSGMRACACSTLASGVRVSCSQINQRNLLAADLADLRGYQIDQFTMTKSNVTLQSHDFEEINLMNMDVESSYLNVASGQDGSFMTSERSLIAMKIQNSVIDFGSMVSVNVSLSNLVFENCTFRNYRNEWFEGLSVKNLQVERCDKMNENIAQGLRRLETYTHTRSNLKALERKMLPKQGSTVKALDFSYNAIKSISDDILDGMNGLQSKDAVINLSNNQLQTLNESAFKNFKGKLNLSNNPLVCDLNLVWLGERLRSKEITELARLICSDKKGMRRSISDLTRKEFEATT